jgi:signal transduction histidine kinase
VVYPIYPVSMRLRTALFAFLLVLGLVLSGTVYAGFALHKQDITDREQENVDVAAGTIATDIDSRLSERTQTVEFAAGTLTHGRTADHDNETVRSFVARTSFEGASIIDANGTMRAVAISNLPASESQRLIGQDFGDRTYFQRARAGETYVSDPVEADSGNLIVTISAPVVENGTVVATFNGALHVRNSSLFRPSGATLETDQRLTVRSGDLLLFNDSDPLHSNTSGMLTGTATVESTGWRVIAGVDRAALEDRLLVATVAQTGAVFVALLAVAIVGIWLSRTIVASVDDLVAGLTALEDGDYDRTLDLDGTDEWVRISETFNTLSGTLDQRESQLRVLNRVLRHNLRNDMSVIIAHADGILHSDADGETKAKARTMRQTAERLVETSDHARTIYEDVLGGHDRDPRPVDVSDLVASEFDRLRAEFPEATIRTQLPDSLSVYGRDALPIVVEELCRNALLHNDRPPAEREVTVTVEDLPSGARLTVSDNGPGLPDVERDLLTREREATSMEHGNGLGLWVVRWLVEQIDGTIAVSSSAEHGADITVFLDTPGDDP